MRFSFLVALFALLAVVSFVDAQLPKLTLKQQKILKRRGEQCLNKYLPKNGQSQQIKSHLQTCFSVDCGNQVIRQVQAAFPALVPQLRTCIGG